MTTPTLPVLRDELECSPYLLRPEIPCPMYVRGQRVWFPDEFGFSTVLEVKLIGNNWHYVFDTDSERIAA